MKPIIGAIEAVVKFSIAHSNTQAISEASWNYVSLKFIKNFSVAAKSQREFLKRNVTFKFTETELQ